VWGDDIEERLGLYDYGYPVGIDYVSQPGSFYFGRPWPAAPSAPALSLVDFLPALRNYTVASDPPPEPVYEPLLIRLTKPTWFNSTVPKMETYDPSIHGYADPLIRLAGGMTGRVDPSGPYYGGLDPNYQVFNISDWAQQGLFNWRLPAISLPPLSFPNAIKNNVPAAAPVVSNWSAWLIYGGLALAAILLLRR
jgi:hypothetical protein